MAKHYSLKNTIGPQHEVDPDDVWVVKQALRRNGFYAEPSHGMTPYPDSSLFDAIKQFQSQNGLRADGVVKAGGKTELQMRPLLLAVAKHKCVYWRCMARRSLLTEHMLAMLAQRLQIGLCAVGSLRVYPFEILLDIGIGIAEKPTDFAFDLGASGLSINEESYVDPVQSVDTPLFARAGKVDEAARQSQPRRIVNLLPTNECAVGNIRGKVSLGYFGGRTDGVTEHSERFFSGEHQLEFATLMGATPSGGDRSSVTGSPWLQW